jgi:hypothetical protein
MEQKRKSSSSYAQIEKQKGDSALVQSKGTKTIYILILCENKKLKNKTNHNYIMYDNIFFIFGRLFGKK